MTIKEFKMCCVVFCKFFEGRKYGEIVQKCHKNDKELIIDVVNLTFDNMDNNKIIDVVNLTFDNMDNNKNNEVLLENELIMWYRFRTNEIKICLDSNIDGWKFKLVKDFLNHFKIPLEDII